MLSLEAAATLFGLPSRRVYGWIEIGALHFQEIASGLLLVCPASLQEMIRLNAGTSLTQSTDEERHNHD
jgi:hypothetical protein